MIEAGILLVIILIASAGILAGRKVQGSSDFLTGGGRASTALTTGALIGTILGSQCTLGTAQLAFNFGISAWWWFRLFISGIILRIALETLGMYYTVSDYLEKLRTIDGKSRSNFVHNRNFR